MNVIFRALRAHQWLKNVVVLLPLFASLQFFDLQSVLMALKGVIAFCAIASCAYIQNDFSDVAHDRQHPKKRTRPFAAGEINGLSASALFIICALVAILIAWNISAKFLLILLTYFLLSLIYSSTLKKMRFLDIIFLVAFYLARILAGAEAIEVLVSPWLFGFAILTFVNLALLKRVVEIKSLSANHVELSQFRPYSSFDLPALRNLGHFAGAASLVIFAFYVSLGADLSGYQRPEILYSALPLLGLLHHYFWNVRSKQVTDDDPVHLIFGGRFSQFIYLTLTLVFFGAVF